MNKIKFNNSEFELVNYNRNTYFNGDSITSNGSCSIKTDEYSNLQELGENPITSIQITHDDEIIYNLNNINARATTIGEYLEYDHMSINVELVFDTVE